VATLSPTRDEVREPEPSGGSERVPTWARLSLLATIAVFLAVSVGWLVADSRILDWDSARHIFNTWAMRNALESGDLLAPITQENTNHYPPLLYLVGSLGMVFGGWQSTDSAMLAMNFVFAPLLALGCWGTARLAYGELAGVLAAVFALGAPMVISTFHLYMLDVPQASLVAVGVWLLLASRRFERAGISALAGLAAGGAMLLKPTAVIFLAGPVLVMLVRGGWRRPLGLAAFLAAGAAFAGPWYVEQIEWVLGLAKGATTTAGTAGAGSGYVTPPRLSVANVLWYGWNLLNIQLLALLFACVVAGTAVAAMRFWRTRSPGDPTPELIAGAAVSYVGSTFITLKDYRYSLAILVFVAVLGVAWIPALRSRRLRAAGAGAMILIAAVNLIGVSAGIGGRVAVSFDPGHAPTPLGERSVRIYSPDGFIANKPRDDGAVLEIMRALRADGFRKLQHETEGDVTFSNSGLAVIQTIAGLEYPPSRNPANMPRDTPFLLRRPVTPGGPRPCGLVEDGWGIYVAQQRDTTVPFESYNLICPGPDEGSSARP
jgi:hypothetical protein